MYVYRYSYGKGSVAVIGPYLPEGDRKEDPELFCDI